MRNTHGHAQSGPGPARMKRFGAGSRFAIVAALLAGALVAGPAAARDGHFAQGRVLSATPIVRIVEVGEPREVCREEVVEYRRNATAPTLVGALIGGAIGNQFGGGNGRRALTVAGAALGGSIANDHANRNRHGRDVRTYCEVVNDYRETERIVGYRVEYEYNGEVYTTRTDRDPGRFIELHVSVSPVNP